MIIKTKRMLLFSHLAEAASKLQTPADDIALILAVFLALIDFNADKGQ